MRLARRITRRSTATGLSWVGWFSADVWGPGSHRRGRLSAVVRAQTRGEGPRPHARDDPGTGVAGAGLDAALQRARGPLAHADGTRTGTIAVASPGPRRRPPAPRARRRGAPAPEARARAAARRRGRRAAVARSCSARRHAGAV